MILFAAALVALLASAAFALDVGHMTLNKTRLQNILDAAVLDGAKTLDLTRDTEQARIDAEAAVADSMGLPGNHELAAAYAAGDIVVVSEFSDTVDVFVPGMIMSVAHPSFDEDRFVRRFAPLSPHTTGRSRSCESCHGSSTALGLGQGKLLNTGEGMTFEPEGALLSDGLPADAWTHLDADRPADNQGSRPLNASEIRKILGATDE